MPLIDIDILAIVFVEELHRLIFELDASHDRERIIENVYIYQYQPCKMYRAAFITNWLVASLYISEHIKS